MSNLEVFKIICYGCFIWGQSSWLMDGWLDRNPESWAQSWIRFLGWNSSAPYASFIGVAHFTLSVITTFESVCSSICVGVCFVCSVFTWFNKISKITLKLYMIIHLGISLTACVHCTCCVLLLFSSIENWHWLLLVTPWKYNQIKPTFSPFRARADCVVCEYQQNDKNSNFDNAQYTDSKNDDDRKNTSIFNRQRKGVCYELVYPICVFIVVQRHQLSTLSKLVRSFSNNNPEHGASILHREFSWTFQSVVWVWVSIKWFWSARSCNLQLCVLMTKTKTKNCHYPNRH